MSRPLLAIDVGNTATSFAVFDFKTSTPRHVRTIATKSLLNGSFPRGLLPAWEMRGTIVSSVVPRVDPRLKRALSRASKAPIHFVSAKSKTKLKIKYKRPSEVGADRLVNARAAMALTHSPAIVIDFGTATTFDCVTRRGEYLGGVIAPGPVISAEALYQKTAKLPLVLLEKPVSILGRNTLQSIQAGLYHGYRGLVKEIVQELKKKMGADTKVYSTGGQARWILNGLNVTVRNIPHLTVMGLYFMWKDLEKSNTLGAFQTEGATR
jgi:type III pantothenate kinase